MLLFLQRLTSLAFSLETLMSIVLGVILGIFFGLPHYIWLFALVGWMLIPISLVQLVFGHDAITHSIGGGGIPNPDWVGWVNWGIVVFYLLFLCWYGGDAYRVTCQTGLVRDGIRSSLCSALVMLLSAILPATFMMMWLQSSSFSSFLFYLGGALVLCFLFAIPLGVMALLTGYIGSWIGKRRYADMATRTT